MPMQRYLELLIWIALLALGQIFFKYAAKQTDTGGVKLFILSLLSNAPFWIALIIYGMATFLWIYILSHTPLKLAYPFSALSFFIVPLLAWYLFAEPLNLMYFIGIFFICIGLIVITHAQ